MTLYPTGASLGPLYSGLAVGYRLVDGPSGSVVAAFTTAGVAETSIPGDYTATGGGLPLPDGFTGRIVWGTATLDLAEEWVALPAAPGAPAAPAGRRGRRPSGRVLANVCVYYPFVSSQDDDAGNDPTGNYPAAAGTFACSYQCGSVARVDEAGRVSSAFVWAVLFATADLAAITVRVNDRVDLLNPDGTVLRSVFVDGALDMAGRGSATEIPCRDLA